MDIAQHALAFDHLHGQPEPLRLPNAWDAGSARLVEHLGAQAIATTSAGVAWSLGYRDGDVLPLDQHLAAVERIARVLTVPLSVDIEGGYADDPRQVSGHVARFIAAGAAGINIQDGAGSPDLLCQKIEQARAVADRLGVRLYINVRTDVYARGLVEPQVRVEETLDRARRYASAGADGLFVLGVVDREEIRAIAAGTRLRLNVIAWPGLPPVGELGALGVRRVSAGSWLPQQLWARTAELASGFLADGCSQPLIEGAAPYAQVNGLF